MSYARVAWFKSFLKDKKKKLKKYNFSGFLFTFWVPYSGVVFYKTLVIN